MLARVVCARARAWRVWCVRVRVYAPVSVCVYARVCMRARGVCALAHVCAPVAPQKSRPKPPKIPDPPPQKNAPAHLMSNTLSCTCGLFLIAPVFLRLLLCFLFFCFYNYFIFVLLVKLSNLRVLIVFSLNLFFCFFIFILSNSQIRSSSQQIRTCSFASTVGYTAYFCEFANLYSNNCIKEKKLYIYIIRKFKKIRKFALNRLQPR